MSRLDRRTFLKLGTGALLGAPFLLPRRASAKGSAGLPKRLVLFHTPQGTVLPLFTPLGSTSNFTLPSVSAPLEPFADRSLFITGLDNRSPTLNTVGNAHQNADFTVFTGQPFPIQDSSRITASGPSFEDVLASRLGDQTPYRRIDLMVGGSQSNGVRPSTRFFHGPEEPVAAYNDPLVAALRIFGDSSLSPEELQAISARRSGVLDGVMQQFAHLRSRLPPEERERLDAHEERVRQLNARISSGLGACTAPNLLLPPGYDASYDDAISIDPMMDIGVAALACDYTRVLTVEMANGHEHGFEWLWGRNGDQPIVDNAQFDNWHAMVHADYQPGMEHVYTWYMEQFAALLARMDATLDADGDNLLDTSLVMWMPEFSSGRHWNRGIPAVLAGCMGAAPMGRWLDFMATDVDSFVAANNYIDNNATTNQLFTSILQAFGFEDESFGHVSEEMPAGGLAGL